jgi:hypothetical protein
MNYTSKTANYTAVANDFVNATSNSFTVTLPTAVGVSGQSIIVLNSGSGVITINTTSSQTIGGVASGVLLLDASINTWLAVTSDGANWQVNQWPDISARYYASSTSLSASLATIVWTTKQYDTLNQMSSGTYTVKVPGKYQVNWGLAINATQVTNNDDNFEIQKNGTAVSSVIWFGVTGGPGAQGHNGSDIVQCAAGDTLRLQVLSNQTSPSIRSSNLFNYISIKRIGD